MADELPLITVPCVIKASVRGWECWSCHQPAEHIPELDAATIARGQTWVAQGVPVRHLAGCIQVQAASIPTKPERDVRWQEPQEPEEPVTMTVTYDEPERGEAMPRYLITVTGENAAKLEAMLGTALRIGPAWDDTFKGVLISGLDAVFDRELAMVHERLRTSGPSYHCGGPGTARHGDLVDRRPAEWPENQ